MPQSLIKNFTQINKEDTQIAGGKGASLGEMTQAGIPVPPGFVILSQAFEEFLSETDLNIEIEAILGTVDIKKIHTVEDASEKIQAMILSKEMPAGIKTVIIEFFKKLDCKFVAVRSSATAEDSASAAWAGQLDSFLNTTEDSILENVKKCWASLFTPRAIFYRFENKLNKDKISVAVVVQKMVDSEESGIAFSVHPVTQDENQLIVEAGFGLGEAIVSGSITPDSYVVEKPDFSILDVNVNEQSKALYKKSKGGSEWKSLGPKGEDQVLTQKEIIELSKLVVKIENHYGFPCDIEWAKEEGMFYIVQSRPITTVGTKSVPAGPVVQFKDYYKDKQITKQEGSFSPLAWGTAASSIGNPLYKKYYSQIEFGPLLFLNSKDKGVGFFNLNSYVACAEGGLQKYLEGFFTNFGDLDTLSAEIKKIYTSNPPEVLESLNDDSLAALIKKTFLKLQEAQVITLFCEALDKEVVKKYFEKFNKDNTVSVDDFFEMASLVTFDSFFGQLDTTLIEFNPKDSYKMQWVFSDYRGTPGLEEIAAKVNELIKEKGGIKKIKQERTGFREEVYQNKKRVQVFKKELNSDLQKIFAFTQKTIEVRDLRKRDFFNCITVLSNSVRELLKRKKIEEILYFYVVFNDFKEGLYKRKNYGDLLRDRKEGALYYFEKDLFRESNTDYNKTKKEVFDFMDRGKGSGIKGSIAQRGLTQGRAKIILDQSQFREFKKGDILITSMTRPEFVPLMKKAKAIVTDEGGVTCHAAIISRELKKPCIIGTKKATRVIKSGDLVEVYADKGVVRVLNEKDDESGGGDLARFTNKNNSLEHADGLPVYFEMTMAGFTDKLKGNHLKSYEVGVSHFIKDEVDYISLVQDQNKIGSAIVKDFLNDPANIKDLYKEWMIGYHKMVDDFMKTFDYNLQGFDDKKLLKLSEDVYDFYREEVSMPGFLDGFMFYAEKRLNDLLMKYCDDNKLNNFTEIFTVLTASTEPSFFNEKEYDLAQVSDEASKDNFLKKYAWINSSYSGYRPYTRKDLENDLSELTNPEPKRKQLSDNKLAKEKLIAKHQFSDEILAIVGLTDLFIKWQDQRKVYTLMYVTLRSKILHEISRRFDLDSKLLEYALTKEIPLVLNKSLPLDDLQKRRDSGVLFIHKNGVLQEMVVGKESEDFVARLQTPQTEGVSKISGTIASKGKVSGKVRVVMTAKSLHEVEDGEILVAPMTRPGHLAGMKKAAAIVTDDGGITCHAAIVSRELGKPCIIGTKIATKVLQDGDEVEVDANQGVVKIVKKNTNK